MARVLVLDGHSAAALAFTRSLGRAGHWVAVGFNRALFAPAALSRYCLAGLEYPAPTDDADGFTAAVAEFVRQNRVELVVPVTDWTMLPLSRFRDRFDGLCRLALPSHEALEIASDKYRTLELARSLAVPAPQTWLIQSVNDLRALPELQSPMVVKDRFSVRWRGKHAVFGTVAYSLSREDLFRRVEERLREAGDVLVQNFVNGTGVGFSCLAADGVVCLPFAWRRIREVDPRGSSSSARKSISVEPDLGRFSEALVQKANFHGLAMVEYKSEAETGQLVLMEINGRPWGSLALPIASGIDYPAHLVRWILDGVVPPREVDYKRGITCRRMVGELTHLNNLRKGKPPGWPSPYPSFWSSLLRAAVPWYPGLHYDDLSWSDPRPGFAGLANWLRVRIGRNFSAAERGGRRVVRGILHAHTTRSHDGKLSLAEFTRLLRQEGFSFVCLTEHSQDLSTESYAKLVRQCREQSDDNFVAIPGLEFRCGNGVEVAGIGVSQWIADKPAKDLAAAIRKAEGFSVWVHPLKQGIRLESFLDCDAVEVMNGKLDGVLAPNLGLLKAYRRQRREGRCFHAIFGLDFHSPRQPRAVWVECEVDSLTQESVLAALRDGRFTSHVAHGAMSSSGEIRTWDYAHMVPLRAAYLAWGSILRSVPNGFRGFLVRVSRPIVRRLKGS